MTEKLLRALGTWGPPPDGAARAALVLSALALLWAYVRGTRDKKRPPRVPGAAGAPPLAALSTRHFLAIAAFTAAMISVYFMAVYLRGGPRIVDASTYFLEGRALSNGLASWPVGEPTASFRGRFLYYREPGVASGIFPPGYPMLLALGFGLGAPMIVGPLLAAALVVATYALARELARTTVETTPRAESIARSAALVSVVCACLRYHTADTMSHGAAALWLTTTLAAALFARRSTSSAAWGLAGLALGALAATRPVSALAPALALAALAHPAGAGRAKRLAYLALGAAPGLLFFAWAARGATGSLLTSPQHAYYAVADGPAGCYRWGFGASVGCLHEHGDFVLARMPHGYGLLEALGTTARRLHAHLVDGLNAEPLALVSLAALVLAIARGPAPARAVGLVVVGHVLAYAPFYFDGSYHGGGARMFADVLPLEHALVALALVATPPRRLAVGTKAAVLVALALAGFSVRAVHDHRKLAARDGGRPTFEPDLLARYGLKSGLLFVDTDQAFALAYDPTATAARGLVVARLREDARDRILFERLGNPPTYLYRFSPERKETADPSVVPWAPPEHGATLKFEAEAEWPPLAQRGGFAVPAWTDACASGRQALAVVPTDAIAEATIELPVIDEGEIAITPHITRHVRAAAWPVAVDGGGELEIAGVRWSWSALGDERACEALPTKLARLSPPKARVVLRAKGGVVALDAISVARVTGAGGTRGSAPRLGRPP